MGIVGSRLKELREKKELSQGDVGKALGISRTAYLQYENGGTAHPRKLDYLTRRKTPNFSSGDISRVLRIYASN